MQGENKLTLTSAEIANLWNMYMHDTIIVCFKKYTIAKAEDEEIRAVLQEALNLSERRSKDIASIFSSHNLPVPVGFSDKDVYIEAPRLYSDNFALNHILLRTRLALTMASTSLFLATHPEVRKLFQDSLAGSIKLNEHATQVAFNKGLLVLSPIVSVPPTPHFVEKQSYIGSVIGENRPLHVVNLMHLFLSIQVNYIGKALITGFSQVAQDSEVKKFFLRGAEIGAKHIKVFSSFLSKEDIPIPQSPDSMVTNSTIAPFSDSFMMNHIIMINSFNMSDIGTAIGLSQRADIAADYMRLSAEIIRYGEDGLDIMIKNGWMEAAPQVVNHRKLAAD